MVQVYVSHNTLGRTPNPTSSHAYNIDGWAFTTIQIGTDSVEKKVSGDCTGCHDTNDWSSMYHRSYFGIDGCLACHDESGNYAKPITNRVHAVHSASETGSLKGLDWSEVKFPRDSCEACHNSGNTSYLEKPSAAADCNGCHGDAPGATDHMIQNGFEP